MSRGGEADHARDTPGGYRDCRCYRGSVSTTGTSALRQWRWVLPLLVIAMVLGVLALHQLSHDRSLVATDSAAAGHHAVVPAASVPVGDAHQVCDEACQPAPTIMVCLLALVLLVGRWVLRAPCESWWFRWADRVRDAWNIRVTWQPPASASRSYVSLLSLGISRT